MKRIISIFISLLYCSLIIGQNVAENKGVPTRFKGVDFFGTLVDVTAALKEKGLNDYHDASVRAYYLQNNIAKLEGSVFGYANCDVALMFEKYEGVNIVKIVHVGFPKQKTWKDLYDTYSSVRSAIAEKYGLTYEEIDNVGGITTNLEKIDNQKALRAIREDNVSLQSFMVNSFDGRAIKVLIGCLEFNGEYEYNVSLIYYTPFALNQVINRSDDL